MSEARMAMRPLAFWTALLLIGAAGLARAARGELVEGIAAQVGSEIVLVSEVRQLVAPTAARMRAAGAPESEIDAVRADALERLIERALVRQIVRRAELEASDEEIDQAVAAIAEENGLSLDQLRRSIRAQGLDFETYRSTIRAEIEQRKVINGMVAARVQIEEAELRALYEQEFSDQPAGGDEFRLLHLLLPSEAAEKRRELCAALEGALGRIRAGEPFAEVAAELHEITPTRGGDLGWIHEGSLAGWMRPIVSSLQAGETSDVVEMPFGCNLLKLLERRRYRHIDYEDAHPGLYARLFNQRMNEEYVAFLEGLREETYIERKGAFAAGPTSRVFPLDEGGAQR